MGKLNRDKPFGEVIGGTGARYEQDNKFFNLAGRECDESGKLIGDAPADNPAPDESPETGSEQETNSEPEASPKPASKKKTSKKKTSKKKTAKKSAEKPAEEDKNASQVSAALNDA